jgi:hypothetical protein
VRWSTSAAAGRQAGIMRELTSKACRMNITRSLVTVVDSYRTVQLPRPDVLKEEFS